MKTIRCITIAVFLFVTLAGCDTPEEPYIAQPPLPPQNGGDTGACGGGNSVCFKWENRTQVYGVCDIGGSCCFSCIDAMGACQVGINDSACGKHGSACVACSSLDTECAKYLCSDDGSCDNITLSMDGTPCGAGSTCFRGMCQ